MPQQGSESNKFQFESAFWLKEVNLDRIGLELCTAPQSLAKSVGCELVCKSFPKATRPWQRSFDTGAQSDGVKSRHQSIDPLTRQRFWFQIQFSIIQSHEMSKRVAFKVHRDVASRYEDQIKVRVVERSSSRDSTLVFCKRPIKQVAERQGSPVTRTPA